MAEQIQEAQESGPPSGEMSFQSLGGVAPEEIELMQPIP